MVLTSERPSIVSLPGKNTSSWHYDDAEYRHPYYNPEGFQDRVNSATADFQALTTLAAENGISNFKELMFIGRVLHLFPGYGACSKALYDLGLSPDQMTTVDRDFIASQTQKFGFSLPTEKADPKVPEHQSFNMSIEKFMISQGKTLEPFKSVIGFDGPPRQIAFILKHIINSKLRIFSDPNVVAAFTTLQNINGIEDEMELEHTLVDRLVRAQPNLEKFIYSSGKISEPKPGWVRYGYILTHQTAR